MLLKMAKKRRTAFKKKVLLLFVLVLLVLSILVLGRNNTANTYTSKAATLFSSDAQSSTIRPQILNVVISQTNGQVNIDDVKKGVGVINAESSGFYDYKLELLDDRNDILVTQPFQLSNSIIM
jgi:hypothetical protein